MITKEIIKRAKSFVQRRLKIPSFSQYLKHRKVLKLTADLAPNPYYKKEILDQSLKVIFVSPIYNSFPLLLVSLKAQTYENWTLLLVHDGPATNLPEETKLLLKDSRVRLIETEQRANNWGHTPRQRALEEISNGVEGDFIIITNSDNYYVPGFIEIMLKHFDKNVQSTYCDMIHNFYSWRNFQTKLEYSFIDCGCLMTRRDAVLKVGWRSTIYEADWIFVSDLIGQFGVNSFAKVGVPLFAHN